MGRDGTSLSFRSSNGLGSSPHTCSGVSSLPEPRSPPRKPQVPRRQNGPPRTQPTAPQAAPRGCGERGERGGGRERKLARVGLLGEEADSGISIGPGTILVHPYTVVKGATESSTPALFGLIPRQGFAMHGLRVLLLMSRRPRFAGGILESQRRWGKHHQRNYRRSGLAGVRFNLGRARNGGRQLVGLSADSSQGCLRTAERQEKPRNPDYRQSSPKGVPIVALEFTLSPQRGFPGSSKTQENPRLLRSFPLAVLECGTSPVKRDLQSMPGAPTGR